MYVAMEAFLVIKKGRHFPHKRLVQSKKYTKKGLKYTFLHWMVVKLNW